MGCFHGYAFVEGGEEAFAVDASSITFGRGVLSEAGEQLRARGCRRVAVFTDRAVARLEPVRTILRSLRDAGASTALYDEVRVEPTDASLRAAAEFAREGGFDGYVSVGGGSVIDTCKAAVLHATYPADPLAYVNAPIGQGLPVPGPLPPHVACPTTCGTGSECTGIAVFDYVALGVKTGIASRHLRPSHALVDPTCTRTLPSAVVASSGFDVLCHALESFTARPYTARSHPGHPPARPMSQGRNPWSDLGSLAALRIAGRCLVRAVDDPSDLAAREELSWAATLAGIAFGNAGVHLPHAMSYAVAGLAGDYHCPGYPEGEPLVPHGMSVLVSAPSVFRRTASACPERHLEAALALGAEGRGAGNEDAGELLAGRLEALMRATGMPNGASGVGFGEADLEALSLRALLQKRLVDNAPLPIHLAEMRELFRGALAYW